MKNKKISYGQFFTKHDVWLKEPVVEFLSDVNNDTILDPFAGGGDLLNVLKDKFGYTDHEGYDIDPSFNWRYRNSLIDIPKTNRLIVTNPPYLAKNSAKRKKLEEYNYFNSMGSMYSDLYQIALTKCMENHDYIVAIVPETIITSDYLNYLIKVDWDKTRRIDRIIILEENPFTDTTCPVVVVCIGKKDSRLRIYKGDEFIGFYEDMKHIQPIPSNELKVEFNNKEGNIGLRGVDGGKQHNRIKFCLPSELNYDFNKICASSRSITVLNVNIDKKLIPSVIEKANELLEKYRKDTADIFLAPFKGNDKEGIRRRRLDFKTAKGILEGAINHV